MSTNVIKLEQTKSTKKLSPEKQPKLNKKTLDLGKENTDSMKEYYQKQVQELENKLKQKQEENRKLKEDLQTRQERYIKREQQFRKNIDEMTNQLKPNKDREGQAEVQKWNEVQYKHNNIQDKISVVQKKTEKMLAHQEKEHLHIFNSRLTELKKELEEERKKKGADSGNYAEKEQQLIKKLDLTKAKTEVAENKNKQLAEDNQRLRLEFKSQENDRELLLRQLIMLKNQNTELMDEIATLRDQQVDQQKLPQEQPAQQEQIYHSRSADTSRPTNLINRLKKQIDSERQKQRHLQTQLVKELTSRTELETLLRQCVEDVKAELTKRRAEQRVAMTAQGIRKTSARDLAQQLSPQDRERIIELLLSQERVLTLFYDKTFPPRVRQSQQSKKPHSPMEFNYSKQESYSNQMMSQYEFFPQNEDQSL